MQLDNVELYNVVGGGFSLSSAYISSINSAVKTIFEFGQSVGTTIRRLSSDSVCSV